MQSDNTMPKVKAPVSDHVDSPFYAVLDAVVRELGDPALCGDQRCNPAIQRVIDAEARLLDTHQYQAWLDLFTDDCVYWMPSTWPAASSARTIALEFHDRRRLLDRIARIDTQAAYSQIPRSRTARVLGASAVVEGSSLRGGVLVRNSFLLSEFRGEHLRVLSGWYGYWIREQQGQPKIALKLINLLDCDHPQGNNSFFI